MFENKSKEEATTIILDSVREYYKKYMVPAEYQDGQRISYASRVFDEEEMVNLVDSSLEFWLTSGRYTDRFEKELGEYLGTPYVSLVNSGSSANLLSFMALTSPLLGERQVKPGDEVITVACGFPYGNPYFTIWCCSCICRPNNSSVQYRCIFVRGGSKF